MNGEVSTKDRRNIFLGSAIACRAASISNAIFMRSNVDGKSHPAHHRAHFPSSRQPDISSADSLLKSKEKLSSCHSASQHWHCAVIWPKVASGAAPGWSVGQANQAHRSGCLLLSAQRKARVSAQPAPGILRRIHYMMCKRYSAMQPVVRPAASCRLIDSTSHHQCQKPRQA